MRLFGFALICCTLIAAETASAQRSTQLGFSGRAAAPASPSLASAALPGNSGTPRWVRWGLVGAVGGAVLFTLADGFNNGAHSRVSNVFAGAATGFVVVGGGVLVYDMICHNESGGRRSGC